MSQAFYRKWRPKTWDELIGQEHIVSTLRNAVAAGRVAHAYLFAGPRGTGKTSSARLVAKAVNCLSEDLAARPCNVCEHCQAVNQGRFLDLIEIDAASNTSVEDVRDLRDKINFSPNQGRFKVYIIDEVHMLSTAAFNALLKTLEEPPAHAMFLLATTEAHKIPATVLSRCQRLEFRRIPVADIVTSLQKITLAEDLAVEPEVLTLIARQATGSMRDAISLLDQLASSGQPVSLDTAHAVLGTAANQAVIELVDAISQADPSRGLDLIHQTLDGGSDPRQFARQIVDYLRNLLLIRMGNAGQVDVPRELRAQMAQHAQAFVVPELLRLVRVFNQAALSARTSWQPALPLELAFIEALEGPQPQTVASSPKARTHTGVSEGARPPKAESPPPDSPPPSEAPAEPLPTGIASHWQEILSQVRQRNPQTQALLNSCKPLGLQNGVLILGFQGELVKSKMEQGEHIKITQDVMQQILGEAMPIRCVISGSRELPPEVDQDGMVASALRDLGGEIVDIQ